MNDIIETGQRLIKQHEHVIQYFESPNNYHTIYGVITNRDYECTVGIKINAGDLEVIRTFRSGVEGYINLEFNITTIS